MTALDMRNIIDPPPAEIVQAAEKVRIWMDSRNRGKDWQLAGVCSREAVAVRDNRITELTARLEPAETDTNAGSAGTRHPVQPLVTDAHGRLRFKRNAIVDHLANGKLNDLASMNFTQEDWEQLAQLIGYSLDGFGTLSYVTDETYNRAAAQVADPNDQLDDVLPLPAQSLRDIEFDGPDDPHAPVQAEAAYPLDDAGRQWCAPPITGDIHGRRKP